MANHTYSKGLLYKKTLNSSGEVTGSVPLLLKTLGSLVIMSDGTDAETAISTAISNMVTPDETTIVTGLDGITISVKKSTSAEIDEILGDVPTSHTWEGYYTKSETEALIDVVDDKISQSGIETALGYTPIPTTAKGSNNGVAELDSVGKVPASQLPSYVDDVIESATYAALPATGEAGKIYVTLNDDKTYRWSGSAYVEISASLALGETSSTAYRGDRGKTAYDHSQAAHARTDATNAAIVSGKLNINGTATNIGDFKAVSTAASQGLTDTEKTNALANIGAVPNSDLIGIVDNGAKNLLSVINYGGLSDTGISVSNIDGTAFHITGSTSIGDPYYVLGYYVLPDNTTYNASISTTGTGSCTIKVYGHRRDNNNWTQLLESYTNQTFITDNTTYYEYMVRAQFKSGSSTTYNADAYPMICTNTQFNISDKYEPYALGNQVITPELIELCDSGAKNLLDLSRCTFTGLSNSYTVSGNTITIISYTTSSGIAELSLTTSQLPTNTDIVLTGCPSGGGDSTYLVDAYDNGTYINGSTDTGSGSSVFKFTTTTQKIRIRLAANYTITNKSFNLMVCTKAAFGVSSKFVPYTKSNSQLTTELGSVKTVLEAIL